MTLSPFQNLAFACIELEMKTETKDKNLLDKASHPHQINQITTQMPNID